MVIRSLSSLAGSRVQVIGWQPRPLLKITPAPSAKDRRVLSFNYVEAVKTLPTNFSDAEVAPIIRRINPKLRGQIRSLFVVLSDDLYRPWSQTPAPSNKAPAPAAAVTSASVESESESEESCDETVVTHTSRGSVKRGASGSSGRTPKAKK